MSETLQADALASALAAYEAAKVQKQQYDTNRAELAAWRKSGKSGWGDLYDAVDSAYRWEGELFDFLPHVEVLLAHIRELEAERDAARQALEEIRAFADKGQNAKYETLTIQETAGYQLAMRRVLSALAAATAQADAEG